ncbi:MAG: hypothetical protein JW829_16065 [Pirellulales bacterium]|nr:hypothetical protein [Pirellulales bacterium]
MLRFSFTVMLVVGLFAGFPFCGNNPIQAGTIDCCCDGWDFPVPEPDPDPDPFKCPPDTLLLTMETSTTLPDYSVTGLAALYYNEHLRPKSITEPEDVFSFSESGGCPGCDDASYSYGIKYSSKQDLIVYPTDANKYLQAITDSSYQRIADRNTPWIEVKNNVGSDTVITRYMMTIGDEAFHFSNSTFDDYIFRSTTDTPGTSLIASVADDGNTLIVDIPGGLAAGEAARFRVDIDPDDPDAFPHPDFRLVFFQMNEMEPGTNSVVTIEQQLCSCVIPEPGTITLLVISVVSIGFVWWRRRG